VLQAALLPSAEVLQAAQVLQRALLQAAEVLQGTLPPPQSLLQEHLRLRDGCSFLRLRQVTCQASEAEQPQTPLRTTQSRFQDNTSPWPAMQAGGLVLSWDSIRPWVTDSYIFHLAFPTQIAHYEWWYWLRFSS
jgi:hypothetical protein